MSAAIAVAAALPLTSACSTFQLPFSQDRLRQLELDLNGRLGVYAFNTANGAELIYRADERFAVCSTCKVLIVAAILHQSSQVPGLMQQQIHYSQNDVIKSGYAPVTTEHVTTGMSVSDLCAAAIQYSDNAAANALLRLLGGPPAVTDYARSLGDSTFRLDRWEPELNTAIPGDSRDTSTPRAMGLMLQQLTVGTALPVSQRAQLLTWLRGNTTGATRVRAGLPSDWQVGDKTGTGDYGVANDLAIIWPPQRAPIIVSVYTAQLLESAQPRNDILAAVAGIVAGWVT